MSIFHRIATVILLLALAAPARAQVDVVGTASIVASMMQASVGGPPIAVLARNDSDLSGFYLGAMTTLCRVAPDNNWCDTDLMGVISDTTNPTGWAQVLTYTSKTTGATAAVCAILPPSPTISAGTIASNIGRGQVFDWRDLATDPEAQAWLMLRYLGMCQGTTGGAPDQKNADAFASLALELIEGSPVFVGAQDVSPARKFSFYDGFASTAWAANVGERVLLELWKTQAAAGLTAQGCEATAIPSSSLNTPAIQRDAMLTPGQDCASNPPVGAVTDANLWLWTAQASANSASWLTVALPPQPYSPFLSFQTSSAGISYAWQTALGVASQY